MCKYIRLALKITNNILRPAECHIQWIFGVPFPLMRPERQANHSFFNKRHSEPSHFSRGELVARSVKCHNLIYNKSVSFVVLALPVDDGQ
jgi:hypothetical protein